MLLANFNLANTCEEPCSKHLSCLENGNGLALSLICVISPSLLANIDPDAIMHPDLQIDGKNFLGSQSIWVPSSMPELFNSKATLLIVACWTNWMNCSCQRRNSMNRTEVGSNPSWIQDFFLWIYFSLSVNIIYSYWKPYKFMDTALTNKFLQTIISECH